MKKIWTQYILVFGLGIVLFISLLSMAKNPEMQNELLQDIALLCGIWDGIVDTFSSVIIFIGLDSEDIAIHRIYY